MTDSVQDNTANEGFEPITTQEQLDQIMRARIKREREKYAGFDDFKAKAEKYDELQADFDAQLEKERADKEAIEAELQAYKAKEARSELVRKVAEATGLAPEMVGILRGETEDELMEAAAVVASTKPKSLPYIPSDIGQAGGQAKQSNRDLFAEYMQGKFKN